MSALARLLLPALLCSTACVADEESTTPAMETPARATELQQTTSGPSVYGDPRERISPDDLERGRLDSSWRSFVSVQQMDSLLAAEAAESWEEISPTSMRDATMVLPLGGDVAGPSVARLQIALDRALFSPGIIDGRWGKNTEKAVYWLQEREGIPATGVVDSVTWGRIAELSATNDFVREHQLSAEDVAGPFIEIPEDIYEQAQMECMCYESLREKLAERFHTSPELLQQLNTGVDLDAVAAGETLVVPAVRDPSASLPGTAERIVISDGGYYLHAVGADGTILAHFPATLGADYDPSPQGEFSIVAIAPDPTWYYQPELLATVDDDDEPAMIPAGPNNAVGVVWMELSEPHYGIHGTRAPETIGYTTSHGCVRLTNWDAGFLSERIHEGITVEFRDVI